MAIVEKSITILFPADYDSQSEFETPLADISAKWKSSCGAASYRLFFIDPVRLDQELKSNVDSGRSYFAEPNLIVLPEVSTAAIKKAVEGLARDRVFPATEECRVRAAMAANS